MFDYIIHYARHEHGQGTVQAGVGFDTLTGAFTSPPTISEEHKRCALNRCRMMEAMMAAATKVLDDQRAVLHDAPSALLAEVDTEITTVDRQLRLAQEELDAALMIVEPAK